MTDLQVGSKPILQIGCYLVFSKGEGNNNGCRSNQSVMSALSLYVAGITLKQFIFINSFNLHKNLEIEYYYYCYLFLYKETVAQRA